MNTITISKKEYRQLKEAERKLKAKTQQKKLRSASETHSLLKLTEPSFAFWENADDSVYDKL